MSGQDGEADVMQNRACASGAESVGKLVMLVFVGAYALLEQAPVIKVAMGFGGVVLVGMLALAWGRRSRTA